MSTTIQILLVAALLVAGGFTLVLLLLRVLRELRELRRPAGPDTGQVALQQQVEALREQVRVSLESGRTEIDRRLVETNRVVGDVRRELGEVDRQVVSVGRAARDLRGLQELLRSPTVRGGMGEYLLHQLLAEVLPEAHYRLQHEFSGGERVDSVLLVGDRFVPVDAKFPLDNFRRLREAEGDDERRVARRAFRADVRRHVERIAKRYIRPGEGTYDFAMMYVPSESVYREVIDQDGDDGLDLFHHALGRRVVPVSPQSFYAYLQVILLGLRGLTIEPRAREIMDRLGLIQERLDRFTESFEIVGRHLGNAQNQMHEAGRRLARVDGAVGELAGHSDETPAGSEPAAEAGVSIEATDH
jgi:DNA recombination protein RmuC